MLQREKEEFRCHCQTGLRAGLSWGDRALTTLRRLDDKRTSNAPWEVFAGLARLACLERCASSKRTVVEVFLFVQRGMEKKSDVQ